MLKTVCACFTVLQIRRKLTRNPGHFSTGMGHFSTAARVQFLRRKDLQSTRTPTNSYPSHLVPKKSTRTQIGEVNSYPTLVNSYPRKKIIETKSYPNRKSQV